MKNILIIAIGLIVLSAGRINAELIQTTNFGYFYANLSPYGSWIEIDNSVYIWKPDRISSHWQPYSDGRWIYTDDGWYWDSYENFGYITYHYGRWYHDSFYGWVWYPGYEWAPSWVEWRYDDDYIGWAPLPPYASFQHGRGIVFSVSWNAPVHYWFFVRYRHFYNDNMISCGVSSNYKKVLFRATKTRNNFQYIKNRIVNVGINTDYIEGRTGRSVVKRRIVDAENLERQTTHDEVKRIVPSNEELRKYSGMSKYNAEVSRGKTTLLLDRVVDENYSVNRNIDNYQPNVKREKVYVKRENINVKREVKREDVVRNENDVKSTTRENNNNASRFENRKNYEQRDVTSQSRVKNNRDSENNKNYQSSRKENNNSGNERSKNTERNQNKTKTR